MSGSLESLQSGGSSGSGGLEGLVKSLVNEMLQTLESEFAELIGQNQQGSSSPLAGDGDTDSAGDGSAVPSMSGGLSSLGDGGGGLSSLGGGGLDPSSFGGGGGGLSSFGGGGASHGLLGALQKVSQDLGLASQMDDNAKALVDGGNQSQGSNIFDSMKQGFGDLSIVDSAMQNLEKMLTGQQAATASPIAAN